MTVEDFPESWIRLGWGEPVERPDVAHCFAIKDGADRHIVTLCGNVRRGVRHYRAQPDTLRCAHCAEHADRIDDGEESLPIVARQAARRLGL